MPTKSLIFVVLWVALSGSARCSPAAPSIFGYNNRPAVRSLVAAYSRYADAVKQHGVDGLRGIASPTFNVQSGGQTLQGQEAFARLGPYLSGLQDGAFRVNILRVSITGDTAVALTEETVGRKSDAQTTVTTERYLRQTWRKVPQGWELEASEQRPPKIAGEAPVVTYTVGSSSDALTPLTINLSDPGTGLDIPPPPRDLLAQLGLYAGAAGQPDDEASLSLLTPDFTCTIDGKPLSHQASLKLRCDLHRIVLTYPGYSLTVNKLFVKPDRATAFVEEKFKGPDARGSVVIFTYVRVQHWVKTAQGWRIGNLARILS